MTRYARSSASNALAVDDPWSLSYRSVWRPWRAIEITLPWPQDLKDAREADAWAQLAERYAAQTNVLGTQALTVLSVLAGAVVGAYFTSALDLRAGAAIAIFVVFMLCVPVLREFSRLSFAVAPAWQRRAGALRRRADELAAGEAAARSAAIITEAITAATAAAAAAAARPRRRHAWWARG